MDKISFHNFRSKTPINNINKKITNHQNVNNVISVYVKVNNDKYKKNKLPIIKNNSKEKINYLKTEESKKILRLNKSNHKFKIKNFNELKEKLNFNLNSNSNSHSNKTIVINNLREEINIAHISDVHYGSLMNDGALNRLKNALVQICDDVDVVIISGDLADGSCVVNEDDFYPLNFRIIHY